jgi:pimeloyl-ACP methyl ester carboxylesterase
MKVYFISGLAADSRVFKYIQLPDGYEKICLEWINPEKSESLQSYALRLAGSIEKESPFALVGLSMGGMIAVEIAKKYKPAVCILLCSVPSHNQMPHCFRWAHRLRLHSLVPIGVLKKASMLKRGFAPDNKADRLLLKEVIRDSDAAFIRWAMEAILSWRNEIIPQPLWHIHGTKDEILPIRFAKPTHTIKGGNHLMIMSQAGPLNQFIRSALLSVE